jgi:hypothetical protein
VTATYEGLADLLATAPADTWDTPSLCEKWRVRHVIAHVTLPARLTPEQFGADCSRTRNDRRAGGHLATEITSRQQACLCTDDAGALARRVG